MKTKKLFLFVSILAICVFGLLFIGCGKDIIINENENKTNNSNETTNGIQNNNENETEDETPFIENENNPVKDQGQLLKGTIWYKNNSNIFIEFLDNYILLRNRQNFGNIGGNLNGVVTHGSFPISSYDGETIKILDYDRKEVAFTIIISENKMTVEKLNAIKWTAPPYEPRSFRQWNGKYTKGEK